MMRARWNLKAATLGWLLAATAPTSAQYAPQEEGLVGPATEEEQSQVEHRSASEYSTSFSASEETASSRKRERKGGSAMGTPPAQGSIVLYGGMRLGAGGKFSADPGGSDGLRATIGLQVGAEYILHDYFALGGEFRMARMRPKDALDSPYWEDAHFRLFDFVVRPRARYAIEKIGLEIYATLPFGLVAASMPDPWDGGVGFTLGAGAGATYMFTDVIGLNLEMTWLKHWFDANDAERNLPPLGIIRPDLDLSTSQFNFLILNAVFVL
jgi:hypothetical protein